MAIGGNWGVICQSGHAGEFVGYVADALEGIGYAKDLAAQSAKSFVSEVEQTAETTTGLTALFEALKTQLPEVFSEIIGEPVRRVLVSPAPVYLERALEILAEDFPDLVIADNFRAGEVICGRVCVPLSEALADPLGFDAYLLGTIRSRYSRYFRSLLPRDRTIGLWELRLQSESRLQKLAPKRDAAELLAAIAAAKRPVVILSTFMDVTLISTYYALAQAGFDVLFAIRHGHLEVASFEKAPVPELEGLSYFHLTFSEMMEVVTKNRRAPVIVNYQRIFSSNMDLNDCLPLFSYTQALMRIISAKSIVQLYDIYNVCLSGFETEAKALKLYHSMLEAADGILVNSDPFDVFDRYIDKKTRVVSLLRFPPRAPALERPKPGPFRIVMITGFLGEYNDPSRATRKAVRSLLAQGLHIHYYSNVPEAVAFNEEAARDFPGLFHLHEPILKQADLVAEISQYDAGWFVVQTRVMAGLDVHFSAPFAKELARMFNASCCGTAPLYYGAAGLPIFTYQNSYVARIAALGSTFDVVLTEDGDLAEGRVSLDGIDWQAVRARSYAARARFFMDENIGPLAACLDDFTPTE